MINVFFLISNQVEGFIPQTFVTKSQIASLNDKNIRLQSSLSNAIAPSVSGEELEMILTDFEQPLVVDAYATWCVSSFYVG